MVEKRTPTQVDEAVRKVTELTIPSKKEDIPLEEAHERYLAEDLVADHDVPSFDRSPYDGFAIRAQDTEEAGRGQSVTFQVIGEIGAGSVFDGSVGRYEAVRIMTGAQIPDDCDAVIMLELVQEHGDPNHPAIDIKRTLRKGDNISFQGEDTSKGTVLAQKGERINPGMSALLATFGYKNVPVAAKPVVGVIATGSELLEVEEDLVPGKIRNSNAYMMMSQIERAGGQAKYFGKFNDDLEDCYTATKQALAEVDCLITTGGASVGDYDFVPDILEKLEASVLFNKVAMRPGSVTTVAHVDGKPVYGLSGNPSACYVGFELFVRPNLRTALFSSRPHLRKVTAHLGSDFPKANPFTRFVRAKLDFEDGHLSVVPAGLDKSGSVTSLATADGFIVLPGGTRGYEKGMKVDFLLLEDQQGSEWPWTDLSWSAEQTR